jgi:ketosteroid isomerase-like protein
VTESDVQIIVDLLPELENGIDMRDFIDDDDAFWERARQVIEPEAEVRFILQGGGTIGAMGGPFHGIDGFRAGWREWLEPWQRLRIVPVEMIDAGEGRVLLLAESHGLLTSGGAEIVQASAAIYRLRDGMIVGIDHYLDYEQARRAAGLN